MPRRIAVLLAFTLLSLGLIWWRWVWLPPTALDLVSVSIRLPQQEHPLDELLRRNAVTLSRSPQLLAQLRRPPETYTLGELLVDSCEVTQGQFGRFASWRAAQPEPPPAYRATPPDWEYKSRSAGHGVLGRLPTAAGGLSFHDAWAYCRAAGGRLPTAAEFEAVASGTSQRLYPWGDEFDHSAWPHGDPGLNISHRCDAAGGAYPATDSEEGIHDLGNSLLEWAVGEGGVPVLMGGNAWHRPRDVHALNFIRRRAAADFRSAYTGFRCVYDEPPLAAGGAWPVWGELAGDGAAIAIAGAGSGSGATEIPLPWGGAAEAVAVAGGLRALGPPAGSRIVPLLRAMQDEEIGVLRHLPLAPAELDLRVMRHEVSRRLYARFLRDPLVGLGFFDHPRQPSYISHEPGDWGGQLQQPLHPVTRLSWWSAWAFARWAGGALPTAEQWEALAGASLQRFPYGNDYEAGRAVDRNYNGAAGGAGGQGEGGEGGLHSAAVTDSQDDSLHGIMGFGGNVAEWTGTSVLRGNAFNVVVKGGSYLMPAEGSQVAQTGETVPDYRSVDIGFRLVFPPEG